MTYAATAAFVLALVLAPAAKTMAQAEGQKPALVVSIASVDVLLGDIGYLTKAAGTPEMGGFITLMSGQFIGGLDTKKPSGIYVNVVGETPSAIAFVAATDFDQVVNTIEQQVGELEDIGGGVRKLSLQRDIFMKHQGGWVFISDSAANLNGLPADPTTMLGGLNDQYNIGIRIGVQSIPEELRKKALSEIQNGFDAAMAAQANNAANIELQENLGKQSIENLNQFMEEADEITIGWGVNREDGKTYLDFSITAIEGSELAKQIAASTNTKSRFSGFLLPEAAATLHFTSSIADKEKAQIKEMLKVARISASEELDNDTDIPNEQVRKLAKGFVDAMIDIVDATIEDGTINGGAAVVLNQETFQFVAGGFVADGKAVEKELKNLVVLAKEAQTGAELDNIKFNAGKHKGVNLHTFSVPIPDDEQEARRVLGDRLDVVVGTGPQSAYVAFGKGSLALLKKVIDRSAATSDAPPMAFTISVGKILEFAATIEADPTVMAMAEALKEAAGKDQVSITARALDRGIRYRIEVGEAVLGLIGQGVRLQANSNQF
jgi:hypothetical protein